MFKNTFASVPKKQSKNKYCGIFHFEFANLYMCLEIHSYLWCSAVLRESAPSISSHGDFFLKIRVHAINFFLSVPFQNMAWNSFSNWNVFVFPSASPVPQIIVRSKFAFTQNRRGFIQAPIFLSFHTIPLMRG